MQGSAHATLKATGEPVVVLGPVAGSGGGGQRYLCQLPPQQPWHRPRYEEIRDERLQFSDRTGR